MVQLQLQSVRFRRFPAVMFCAVVAWMVLARPLFALEADTPVTPNASPEARRLLAFFSDIYGKRIISGQQDGWQRTNGLSFELNYITNTTGELPALLAMDVSGYTDKSPRRDTNHRLVQHALDWHQQRHGLVEFCWHWRAPMNQPAFYTKETSFDISRAVTDGTPENVAILHDMDLIASELEIMRDAHVPVLWRPLHEANGRWFWWGAGGPEPLKKLWRMMFENFTVKHHLDNLIWVFSPGAEVDLADWYPGDAFVDIIGQDHYPMDGNHGPAKDVFDELTKMTRGQKLIGLGENGPVPDVNEVVNQKAGWLFFTTWSGSILFDKTTPQELRADYDNPYVLNLDGLPDLNKYPATPAGKAVRLEFCGAPGDVAADGIRRMPVTVAVRDGNGRTVREGIFSVALILKNSQSAKLSGSLTARTVNGIATFSDVRIDADDDGQFVATAEGLKSAVSPVFHVGPGNGLLREWWRGRSDFSAPPEGKEILGSAVEFPVTLATNFSSRISGELIAPQSGNYKFWLAGAGGPELWLADDSSAERKVVAVTAETRYAKWPHINEAESGAVTLTAGKRYHFEIRQWQSSGSVQLHVRWQLPDGSEERPIPAYRFAQPEKMISSKSHDESSVQ